MHFFNDTLVKYRYIYHLFLISKYHNFKLSVNILLFYTIEKKYIWKRDFLYFLFKTKYVKNFRQGGIGISNSLEPLRTIGITAG